MEAMETLGQRIVHYRKKAGLLQKDLASKLGISASALNLYEKDKREPNALMIKGLANSLGITGDALLGLKHLDLTISNSDEYKLLKNYRMINEQGKEYIRQSMTMALNTYAARSSDSS